MLHRLFYSSVLSALLLLYGCQGYDFTLNKKIVYTDNPLFSEYTTPDPGLNRCLAQAINDGTIRSAAALGNLDCSYGGIENLRGLATFSELTSLRLSTNNISDLAELNRITTLQELYLDNNQIIDPAPLYQLTALRHVDLSRNPGLRCPPKGSFGQSVTLILPDHCR